MSNPAGGRTARRRQSLMRAAAGVFAQSGYHGATVAAIAERAGVAAGTFYLYFASKESCFQQLVEELYQRVLDEITVERRSATTALDKIDASVRAVLRSFQRERELATVVLLRAREAPQTIVEQIERIEQTLVSLLASDLLEARALEQAGVGDPVLAAHLVIGAMREALLATQRAPVGEAGEQEVVRFIRAAIAGGGRPPA